MNANKITINQWDRQTYMVQIEDAEANKKVCKWKFARLFGWGVNYFMRQYLIPASKKSFVCKKLGIQSHKNPNRVKAGLAASKKHPLSRGQNDQEPHRGDKKDTATPEYTGFG